MGQKSDAGQGTENKKVSESRHNRQTTSDTRQPTLMSYTTDRNTRQPKPTLDNQQSTTYSKNYGKATGCNNPFNPFMLHLLQISNRQRLTNDAVIFLSSIICQYRLQTLTWSRQAEKTNSFNLTNRQPMTDSVDRKIPFRICRIVADSAHKYGVHRYFRSFHISIRTTQNLRGACYLYRLHRPNFFLGYFTTVLLLFHKEGTSRHRVYYSYIFST
jgi:hypothetical protein